MTLCRHRNITFPQTRNKYTWVTCLSCGKELHYSWDRMEVVKPSRWQSFRRWVRQEFGLSL